MENIIKNNREFVVIDIETSHFHPNKGAMIIEIAAVKIRDGKVIDKRTQLINPERKITAKITEITGITNEMLEGKPHYREVLPKFYEFLGDAVVVAHNAQFDWDRFLIYFFNKLGIYPKNEVVDTLKLSRKHIKNAKSYKLGDLCNLIGIEHKDRHRALGDTEATAKLFLYLLENIKTEKQEGQISIMEIKEESKQKIKPQEVRKVAYWKKDIKGTKYERFYVTLDRSVVFYDIPTNAWEIKSSNEPIDLRDVENKVLSRFELRNMNELIRGYANYS